MTNASCSRLSDQDRALIVDGLIHSVASIKDGKRQKTALQKIKPLAKKMLKELEY